MVSISLKGRLEHDNIMTLLMILLKVNSDYIMFFMATCVQLWSKQPEIS